MKTVMISRRESSGAAVASGDVDITFAPYNLRTSEFGLNRVRKSMGNVLSGGERRRTEIARALATDPKFILLDEPFAGIDPIAVEDIQRIVEKLKEKKDLK